MKRRAVLAGASGLLLGSVGRAFAQEVTPKRTYVLVHGAFGGGWDWRTVSDQLQGRGHTAFRPTLTGLGERVHLSSPQVGLSTHISDIENTLLYENLRGVTLVGHSYGGMVVTGVADRLPERIARLIYVDAFVPENGESVASLNAVRAARGLGEVQGEFIVPTWVEAGTPPPHDVPQPLKANTEPIVLSNPLRTTIPTTYILTVDRGATTDAFDMFAARASTKRWQVERLTSDHNAQRSVPKELVKLLELAR